LHYCIFRIDVEAAGGARGWRFASFLALCRATMRPARRDRVTVRTRAGTKVAARAVAPNGAARPPDARGAGHRIRGPGPCTHIIGCARRQSSRP